MGALSLNHLDRIEEKLLENFDFDAFHAMGYGRFLQYILHEAKQVICCRQCQSWPYVVCYTRILRSAAAQLVEC